MLVSSSDGFCLEGLVAAILLRAAMVAVLEFVVVLGSRLCGFMIAVGLSSRVRKGSSVTPRNLFQGSWHS